jgi:NADH:ubiquinone oxidoreductase subunit 2 (subunit N)
MKQYLHFIFYLIAMLFMGAVLALNGTNLAGVAIPLMLVGLIAIYAGSIRGIIDDSLIRFSALSCAVQVGYFVLDAGTAAYTGKSIMYAAIQFVNFGVSGLLFALVLFMLQRYMKKDGITDFAGFYHKNQALAVGLIVACLAFGGLPAFNIFVGEYLIYALLYSIHPFYALFTVFGSLIAFLFYFRLVYITFGGKEKPSIKAHVLTKAVTLLLALAVIILGMVPWILFKFLELVA